MILAQIGGRALVDAIRLVQGTTIWPFLLGIFVGLGLPGSLGAAQQFSADLAELRRFEHFKAPKWLRLLRPTPEGRHYSGIGGTGRAVIWGVVGRAAPV